MDHAASRAEGVARAGVINEVASYLSLWEGYKRGMMLRLYGYTLSIFKTVFDGPPAADRFRNKSSHVLDKQRYQT
ncbi:MAG: hypothetical protein CV081_06865 [Nitrospira sp. LK265]|nr:hypothetical protein [Nitrospira sp. LK265]